MLDRQKVETILMRRFPGARSDQVAAAANAIMGLPDEWEEVLHADQEVGHRFPSEFGNISSLMQAVEDGVEFRLFRRCES